MSVKRDPATGSRSVAVEAEAPGTPEEVWETVAWRGWMEEHLPTDRAEAGSDS